MLVSPLGTYDALLLQNASGFLDLVWLSLRVCPHDRVKVLCPEGGQRVDSRHVICGRGDPADPAALLPRVKPVAQWDEKRRRDPRLGAVQPMVQRAYLVEQRRVEVGLEAGPLVGRVSGLGPPENEQQLQTYL